MLVMEDGFRFEEMKHEPIDILIMVIVEADRLWSEIGISQFLLDLFQFRFSMLWGTGVVPFGTRGIQIWIGSIPVSLSEMRKWYKGRNRRMRRLKPSAITNIIFLYCSLPKILKIPELCTAIEFSGKSWNFQNRKTEFSL